MYRNKHSTITNYSLVSKDGFSLIELMIALAIIAIIAGIAYPSYQSHLLKSRRAEAQTTLQSILNTAQQYQAQHNNQYPGDLNTLFSAFSMTVPTSEFYEFDLNNCGVNSPNCTARATVITGTPQEKDKDCSPLTLDTMGNRTPVPTGTNNCWAR